MTSMVIKKNTTQRALIVAESGLSPLNVGLTGVPAVSNLSAYTGYVNSLPMLSEEREIELAKRWENGQDLEAVKELILAHLRLVVRIARDYSGYGLSAEDLIQEGNVGLMKAVRGFSLSHGVRLASYAMVWIRSQIQEYILDNYKIVKIGSGKGLKKLFYNLRSSSCDDNGVPLSEEKIAKELDVSIKEVQTAKQWFAGTTVSLDSEEDHAQIVNLASGDSIISELIESESIQVLPKRIQEAISVLNQREQEVIRLRYLVQDTKTLSELSHMLGVSVERVRQIEVGALKKLKDTSGDYLKDFL